MTIATQVGFGNQLLDRLIGDERQRIAARLEKISVAAGETLHSSGLPRRYAYFPCGGLAAVLYDLTDGSGAAVAMVGNEGFIGAELALHMKSSAANVTMQMAGDVWKLDARVFVEELHRDGAFMQLLLRYVQVRIAQIAQIALCNRFHSIEQQLSRWLVLAAMRTGNEQFKITQERIAHLLGVRREGISEAAKRLRVAGLIKYSNGQICIVSLERLKARSCECAQVILDEYAHNI